MTQSTRIVFNVAASYGRSIYSIAIGLFCGRWTLMALGHVDYGLMGVVGGLAGMVAFLNNLMATAVARFYAFNIGAANKNGDLESLENSRRWFNTAVFLHTALPIILVIIGYPLGCWAISSYLTIPPNRVVDCIWVWRFVCCSCFVSMINVPFRAMYTAKQEIAELTVYSLVTTTLNVLVLYYMVNHPSVWLVKFMLWTCLLSVTPQVIITIRAFMKYPECRLNLGYLWDGGRVKAIVSFAGGRFIYAVAFMLSVQGATMLVNKMLGPIKNAAMAVGSTVSSHCLTLASAISGAFSPVITQYAGAKDYVRMRRMMIVTCTMSAMSVIVFTLPLIFESRTVLVLWLKNPPQWSAVVSVIVLIQYIFARITDGLWMGIFAMGRIAKYQVCEAAVQFTVLPLAYISVNMGLDIVGVASVQVIAAVFNVFVKLYFAKNLCGLPMSVWIRQTFLPLAFVSGLGVLPGFLPYNIMQPSFLRVVITTVLIEMTLLPLAWFWVIPEEAKQKIKKRFSSW